MGGQAQHDPVPRDHGKLAHSGGCDDEAIARIAIAGNQWNPRSLQRNAGADPGNLCAGGGAGLPEPSGRILSIEVGALGWVGLVKCQRGLPSCDWGKVEAAGFLRLGYRNQCLRFHKFRSEKPDERIGIEQQAHLALLGARRTLGSR